MKLLLHLQAILLLTFMVTVLVPTMILLGSGLTIGWGLAPLDLLLALFGGLLIIIGFVLVAYTIGLFFNYDGGALAPWTPTSKLVVRGVYRHVRNPMISGILSILLGESLLFSSSVIYWFGFILLVNMIYIPLIEEPDTESRFGVNYRTYKRNVPRWIPRPRPWTGT